MSEYDALQFIITTVWIVATILLATNRYVIGCFVMLAGMPAWWMAADQAGMWGFKTVAAGMAIVYTLGIIGRWPRKPKKLPAPDEHETEEFIG